MTKKCAHEIGPWLAGQQWPLCLKCEIEQLRGNLSLAEEGLASAMQESERQKAALVDAWNETQTASIEIERLQGEYTAYRADGEPELRAANAEIMRLLNREQQLMEFLRSFINGGVNQEFKTWGRELYQKLYSSHEPEKPL